MDESLESTLRARLSQAQSDLAEIKETNARIELRLTSAIRGFVKSVDVEQMFASGRMDVYPPEQREFTRRWALEHVSLSIREQRNMIAAVVNLPFKAQCAAAEIVCGKKSLSQLAEVQLDSVSVKTQRDLQRFAMSGFYAQGDRVWVWDASSWTEATILGPGQKHNLWRVANKRKPEDSVNVAVLKRRWNATKPAKRRVKKVRIIAPRLDPCHANIFVSQSLDSDDECPQPLFRPKNV